MDSMTTGVLVVAGAGLLAWVLRGISRGDEEVDRTLLAGGVPESGQAGAGPRGEDEEPDPDEPDGERVDQVAVVTSNGWMFMPFDGGVRLWAPAEAGEELGDLEAGGEARLRPAGMLSAGDLIAARVVRGTPGEDPWQVEALGRDREFSSWSFETEEAARAACELLECLVVKVPMGPDGEPAPLGDDGFAEARRIAEETLSELASPPDTAEPEEPR